MKKATLAAAGFVNLGLMLAYGNAPGQEESPGSEDAKTAATATNSAKGSVEVKLTEYKIEMPSLIGTGATTFDVTNAGNETHGFEIEGNGIEAGRMHIATMHLAYRLAETAFAMSGATA